MSMGGPTPIPVMDRILRKTEVGMAGHDVTPCFLWTGRINSKGYGTILVGSRTDGSRRTVRVHRVAWAESVGPLPSGLEPDHLCRVTRCWNPDHLEWVSHQVNIKRGATAWPPTRDPKAQAHDPATGRFI